MGQVIIIDQIKPYSSTDLAAIYGVGAKTFKKWILPFAKEIGKKNGRYYSAAQVQVIFDKLGVPYNIKGQ